MEKTISPEERIRRAEEIYYRRKLKNGNVRMPSSQVTEKAGKRQFSLYKKMVLQILICVLIYLIFSLIKETNYLFSENVINKTKEFLSTDINFSVISGQVGQFFQNNQGYLENWLNSENTEQENNQTNSNEQNASQEANSEDQENNTENQNNEQNVNQENTNTTTQKNNNTENQNSESQNKEDNTSNQNQQTNEQISQNNNEKSSIGGQTTGIGGTSNNEETVSTSANSSSKKTQMQIDAEYIKANFKLQLPAKGEVTSDYGKREPTEIVSENHQGIDIGVVVGTTIVAAMEGEVSVVSSEGDYGTHVKIVNKDVTTIYAHCSKILVKEGESVKKGQKIALSGNTGNTTGPHLHFEIRRNERTVDPAMILDWTYKS